MAQQAQVTEEQARALAEESRESGWDKPSFAKELFLGRFPLDLIHPFPRPSDADEERIAAFLEKLRDVLRTMDGSVIERDAQIPDEYVRALAELGCFGMKIPTEYGGLGMSQVAYNRALMMVTTVHPSIGALLSAHQSIGVPEPLKLAGTDEQKRRFLPRCAAGAISAFLLTEPDVGSDPARLGATATPTEDGQAYLLDGLKLWTTNGVVAELLVVMARVPKSEGHRGGISAFVVEADSPGITVERRNQFMGLRGIENGLTRMHRVRVPAENLIGREGDGLKIALTTLNVGRLALPAMATGSAKWSLKIAREWSRERVQWGKPVGKHEAVARQIAYLAATTYALDAVVELSGQMADEGRNDIRIEAALAKLWASETTCRIADDLVQIRGGRGYETAESLAARGERAAPVEQQLRDLRINRIFEGSSEIMRLLIAREAVDAHLTAAGDLAKPDADLRQKASAAIGASGFYAKWLPKLVFGEGQRPTSYSEFGPLASHLRFVERSSRKLARNTFYGMARWQANLEQKQGFLGRIVDIGAELFAMAAACVRAEAQRAADPAIGKQAYELAELFCAQATLRVEELFRGLWSNTDSQDVRLANDVLDDRYLWLEGGILDQSEGTGPWIAPWEPRESTDANLARRFYDAPAPAGAATEAAL
ncbi:acyl-CoA dehydrogenase family protein [Mycobacterium bourgelatii]|uniref:Putative acyl-CoA dehydrogenase FadE10 n=1 Tax=Mycobacterium bourgelatii TaxID=1273442 RepID=A0A7I9YVK7_MYCBU|nr:acyl-CoA dehydrogenase family protein [Mycobacterium bourgelatii]MCV6975147.1 acyl-CoA dehydrogenase family protein [Mycobacterium bourgelatii]GFG92730.1 putative acyl-CoA dehydrogenase FadE10 [Mycobacterium bourgelatii]